MEMGGGIGTRLQGRGEREEGPCSGPPAAFSPLRGEGGGGGGGGGWGEEEK